MPWRLKRQLILVCSGAVIMALAIVVWVLNDNPTSDVLAALGFVGGVAVIINTLPADGNGG